MDKNRINPDFLNVEFVYYYMQTLFQPQTLLFHALSNKVETREQTYERDRKYMQFEDGWISNLPEGMQDGRLTLSFGGEISHDVCRRTIPLIRNISENVSKDFLPENPGIMTQFMAAIRVGYLLKDDLITYLMIPFVSERKITPEFLESLGKRLIQELGQIRLKAPALQFMERKDDGYVLSFTGRVMEKQFFYIVEQFRETLLNAEAEQFHDNAECGLRYIYTDRVVDRTIITLPCLSADDKIHRYLVENFYNRLRQVF
jgi:hypothetical protein